MRDKFRFSTYTIRKSCKLEIILEISRLLRAFQFFMPLGLHSSWGSSSRIKVSAEMQNALNVDGWAETMQAIRHWSFESESL